MLEIDQEKGDEEDNDATNGLSSNLTGKSD